MDPKKRRQETALEKFEKFNMLTPEGKNWLIAATDPFHDSPLQLEGYPDLNISGSIVQCVKKSLQISVPSGISSSVWDCNVVLWPMANSVAGVAATCYNGAVVTTQSPATAPFFTGGLTACATASGHPTFFNANSGGATGIYDAGHLSLDDGNDGYMTGTGRVIGMGFEIYNTTAPLYRQGQLAVYRQPINALESSTNLTNPHR